MGIHRNLCSDDNRVLVYAGGDAMRKFMCYWGGGYPEGVTFHDLNWFDVDRGYTPSHIEDVTDLDVGETVMMDNGDHIVTRVQ